MSSFITASDVSFELPNGRTLFSHLHFSLSAEVTALVGPNGVGKTCLAQILSGRLEPTDGAVQRRGDITLFRQRETPPPVTVDEYLALDYVWSELGEKMLSGIDRQTSCTDLSGGQWMRVRLAKSLGGSFLILDEPTNDLDRDGRAALLEFLQSFDGGILLISHDRECLRLCRQVLELSPLGLAKFGGGWTEYEEAKERERENLADALEAAKRQRTSALADREQQKSRQEKRNRQGTAAAARGGMPKILLGARKRRAQTTTAKIDTATLARAEEAVHDAYEAFSRLKLDPVMYADLAGDAVPTGKLIAEAKNFNVLFNRPLYREDLNFVWRGNLRLAIKGPNGSGKSTLLKILSGETFETRGEWRTGGLRILYIDQKCGQLNENETIFENVRAVSTLGESEIRNALAKFLFAKEAVFQKVSTLSGGERLRAALACGLLGVEKPQVLLLDEPTNNLDLANVEFLENLVRAFKGAVIAVSHDPVFLKNCGIEEELPT